MFQRYLLRTTISDDLKLSQWQTNLKMHSLTKNLLRQSVFVADLEQTPFFLKSDLNIKHCSFFALLKNLDILPNLEEYIFNCYLYSPDISTFWIRTFLALSNDQGFSSFHWKNCLPFLSQVLHSALVDWLIFEDEQLSLVHLNLT